MRYRAYSDYLKEKYGEKVYKLPINLPLTCPNRDNTCGMGGCIFCGEQGAGLESLPNNFSVARQLSVNKEYIAQKYKARKFIPYFQNFSNTYLPLDELAKHLFEAAAFDKDVVAVSLATRPDCLHDRHLELLKNIQERYGIDITVELGLQTVNYHTLKKINRGHTLAEFIDAALRMKTRYGQIRLGAHVILNLPWDNLDDVIENAKVLSALKADEVKLHALYLVRGTPLERWRQEGKIVLKSMEEYVEHTVTFLEYLHPDIALGRLIGRAPAAAASFANWQTAWWKIRDAIEERLAALDTYQGKKCDYLNGWAASKYI